MSNVISVMCLNVVDFVLEVMGFEFCDRMGNIVLLVKMFVESLLFLLFWSFHLFHALCLTRSTTH